jgi:iron(III)-salmochelin esterase
MASWGTLRVLLSVVAIWLSLGACRDESSESLEVVPERAVPHPPRAAAEADAPVPVASPEGGARLRELTWSFDPGPFGPTDVVVSMPERAGPDHRLPVVIALHGRGESLKGNRRGARGWVDDYDLERAMTRLEHPPLTKADFQDFVTSERLRRINRRLAERPYAGVIVVCPYLPDVLRQDDAFSAAGPLAEFIVDVLLPEVYRKTPAIGTPATTGIDGVSLGGRAALLVGFTRPKAFGAVGALQAAIDSQEIERFVELGASALAANPKLELRLLTSDKDHFLRVNQELSSALGEKRVPHLLLRVTGTHSYQFNRGPGAFEMLLFHDRVLRGLTWD